MCRVVHTVIKSDPIKSDQFTVYLLKSNLIYFYLKQIKKTYYTKTYYKNLSL